MPPLVVGKGSLGTVPHENKNRLLFKDPKGILNAKHHDNKSRLLFKDLRTKGILSAKHHENKNRLLFKDLRRDDDGGERASLLKCPLFRLWGTGGYPK